MRILWRYILREFLVPLGYCLAGFVGIYVLFELFGSFSRMSAAHLPLGTALKYLAAYLSPFFKYLAPAALMLATLYTMWGFCRHSELTAMRASGVSLLAIVRPLLFAAFLVACLVAWVNEMVVPAHALWAKRLRTARFDEEAAESLATPSYSDTERRHSWTVTGTCSPDCSRMTGLRLSLRGSSPERHFEGVRADWLDGEWWLTLTNAAGQTSRYENGLSVRSRTPELDALPLRLLPELTETPQDILLQQTDALPFGSVLTKLRFSREASKVTADKRRDLAYDAWAQAVSPLACLVITLLVIPAGVTTGRRAVFGGVVGAIGLFFAYYGLEMACLVFAKTGLVPPIPAALLPLVSFFALGVFNFFRPLRLTFAMAFAIFALVGAYVGIAWLLTAKVGVGHEMAHSLAATPSLLVAAVLLFALRPARREAS